MTQADIDYLIETFQLRINPLVIYTGRNLFDATFLNVYFHNHGLTDYQSFRFMNLRDAVSKSPVAKQCSSTSKDTVARAYNIALADSHKALGDCKIESAIAEYLYNNIMPRNYLAEYENIITIMRTSYDTMTIDEATKLYEELCNLCRLKNGAVNNDYDNNPRKRGGEGIDIHHIDETVLDDIAKRTMRAQETNDIMTLKALKPYNEKKSFSLCN